MKKLVIAAALLAAGGLCLQDVSIGHGGTYRGPGDTVPPGGGGGGGGSGPATPGPTGPSSPGPAGPGTPGPATPGAPAGTPTGAKNPTTGGGISGPDLTTWEFWWGFNKEPYLNLKAAIHSGDIVTGSDDFFLGKGEQSQSRDIYRPSEEKIRQRVVPALIQALQNERQNDIVTGCLIALAKIGDPKDESGQSKGEFASIIKAFLSDSSQEISETAAVSLGILGNLTSIQDLTDLATNTTPGRVLVSSGGTANEVHYRTRSFATYGLGLVGYQLDPEDEKQGPERPKIVQTLVQILEGDGKEASTRDLSVAAVVSMGLIQLPSNPEFVLPEDTTWEMLDPTAWCLEAQIEYLLTYYEAEDVNYLVQAHCPISIARLLQSPDPAKLTENRADSEFKPLKERAATLFVRDVGDKTDKQKEIQQSCVVALGLLGDCDADPKDEEIRKALIDVTKNLADLQARNCSMIACAQVGGRPGHGEGDRIEGLKDIRSELTTQLAKGKSSIKSWAGLSIGVLERALTDSVTGYALSSDMTTALRTALGKSKTTRDVGAYAIGLGIMRDPESKRAVRKKLEQMSQPEARGYCAIALGLMGDTEAIEQIQEVVKASKFRPELLRSAAIALGLLGDKQLVEDLIQMLKEAGGLSSQAAISSALGSIGDARSIEPLIEMLENQEITDLARGFAAVALGIVADKEPLPWNAKISTNINYRANTTTLTDTEGTGILDIL